MAEARSGSTLAKVARAAGVSIATASRVLNGENKELWAGPAARAERVRRAAKRLGYRPDWRARALRGGRTNSIGVVYSEVNPMMDIGSYMPMFHAFGEVLRAADYHMMFIHVPRTTGLQPASILEAVDAAVFYHNITEGELEAARMVRGPAIIINCEPKLPYPRVNPDEVGGAKDLTRHLLELGHRRVAFVELWTPGAEFDHFSRVLRQNVIRQVMTEAGLANGFSLWSDAFGTPFHQVVARFRNTPKSERPTAMVVSYSLQAIGLLNEFVRQGIRVPDELSLATFDDHSLVEHAVVPMTTVAVPMKEMGRTAAGLILGLLQKPRQRATTSIVLPEQLVVRESTGRAPH
jgi:LacI family transcriptional regulator